MRPITREELILLNALCLRGGLKQQTSNLLVDSMSDGGMGSFLIGSPRGTRRLGRQAAMVQFKDSDGVAVSASLNIDQNGDLFEVDIFKGDFSKLIRWPSLPDLADNRK